MKLTKAMAQVLLAVLFVGCLMPVPYGYYQFLRLASLVLFGLLAYNEYRYRNYHLVLLCICAALLFNPILPVYLDKGTWQEIDKIMASLMLLWIIVDAVLFFVAKARKAEQYPQEQAVIPEEGTASQ